MMGREAGSSRPHDAPWKEVPARHFFRLVHFCFKWIFKVRLTLKPVSGEVEVKGRRYAARCCGRRAADPQ
jgi:hypothetical protein